MMIALLAAGSATRFGGGKLDAPLRGKPLGAWALDRARAAGWPLMVIAGAKTPGFAQDCAILTNPDAARGMGTSIRLAARAAREAGAQRLLVMLADMPFVSEETLGALADAPRTAACAYPDGTMGPPACFTANLYPLLEGLPPDKGAQGVLRQVVDLVRITPPPQELADIDTREDLARLG